MDYQKNNLVSEKDIAQYIDSQGLLNAFQQTTIEDTPPEPFDKV